MALDSAWIGVIGTGIGALASGIPTFGTAVVQSLTARGQRKHDAAKAKEKREADAAEAKEQRDHDEAARRRQVATGMLQQRRSTIANWREQLRFSRNVHDTWKERGNHWGEPNVVGEEWFEELRPHLAVESPYATSHEVHCDIETVTALSIQIGRIEREWTAEAQG